MKEGHPMKIVIMREVSGEEKPEGEVFLLKNGKNYQKRELMLTPGRWEGRGLLGCKIDSISS